MRRQEYPNRRGRQDPPESPNIPLPDPLEQWKAEAMISAAESLAQSLGSKLDTQLRRIFDALKKLEMESHQGFQRDQVIMLKPRLAYTVSRTPELKSLYRILDQAINRVHSQEDFKKLVDFMEAVLAYYKFYSKGGAR